MSFTEATHPNLCVFCYKSIPPENQNSENIENVNQFCTALSKFLNCQIDSGRGTSQKLSASSFGSCNDCKYLITQFGDLYHQIKSLELHLFWKLESLGKTMTFADKLPSRVAKMTECFGTVIIEDNQLNGPVKTDLEEFKLLRSKIKKKCDFGRKLSKLQPHVSLKRLDPTAVTTINANKDDDFTKQLEILIKTEETSDEYMNSDENGFEDYWNLSDLSALPNDTQLVEEKFEVTNSPDPLQETATYSESSDIDDHHADYYYQDNLNVNINVASTSSKIVNHANKHISATDLVKQGQTAENPKQDKITNDNTEKLVSCQQCGTTFKRNHDLKRHEEKHKNPEDWKYQCSYCNKKWPSQKYLSRHMVTHSEGKAWKCDQCGKRFKFSQSLQKHLELHSNKEDCKFQCLTCGRKCVSAGNLQNHLKIHSDERPLKCDQCGAGFKREHDLKRHGEHHKKPEEWKFECSFCKNKCPSQQYLKRHMLHHSKEIV